MNNTKKGILMALATPTLWGLMTIPIRTLSAYGLTSRETSFFRCLVSGTGLFLLHYFSDRETLRIDRRGLLHCLIYGCICYGLSFTAYATAVAEIPVAVAMVLMFLCPVYVSILNLLIFHEPLKPVNTISIVICLIGAVLVSNVLSAAGGAISLFGIGCALFNGLGCGLQLIIPRYFEKSYKKDTFVVYGFLGSALMLSLFTSFPAVARAIEADPVNVPANIIFLSAICTLVPNTLFVKASGYISGTLVSILSGLEVVVGSLVGILLYKETMSPAQTVGAVIIVIGASLPNLKLFLEEKKRSL